MKKAIIIIGILSLVLFAGKLYASTINHNETHCNYLNCTKTGNHYHHEEIENEAFHCEVEGCHNTEPHTHEISTCNNCNQNNYNHNYQEYTHHQETYSHHNMGHHRNHH